MRSLSCGVLVAMLSLAGGATAEPELDRTREDTLRHLIRHDCGSCHGLTLRGGLGPALTPDALAGKPRELLVNSVIHGRPGTAMPPWESLLSDAEIEWIIEQLLEGLPE